MKRVNPKESVIVELDLNGVSNGDVLEPMKPVPDAERTLFGRFEAPLSPWGGFRVGAGFAVEDDGDKRVLAFATNERWERAILARGVDMRDGHIVAVIRQTTANAAPNEEHPAPQVSLAGIVFRVRTSRAYYQFGIEGQRRLVLYRRNDAEYFELASHPLKNGDEYLTLDVKLDGDGIRCSCPEAGAEFRATDTTYRSGGVGVRSRHRANLASFSVSQTPSQTKCDAIRHERADAEERELGRDIPDATLFKTYDLRELGGSPTFHDFASPDRIDMLVAGDSSLRALTDTGEVIWELGEPVRRCVFSSSRVGAGRLIYGFAGNRSSTDAVNVAGGTMKQIIDDEMVVIDGATGEVLARKVLPPDVPTQRFFDWSPTSARLSSAEGTDIVLREWRDDSGGGGKRLWALDRNLNLLWDHDQTGMAHYGHHAALAFHDVNRDGRDELLAGGHLYDADGHILWSHDRAGEMLKTPGGVHYDAVVLGDVAGDEEDDPIAFLIGGSGGVFIVDALTGETRAFHRVGHAQGRMLGKVRPDLPGTEVLVATRWSNFGILTLFSGRGERLWTIQPDYVGQGATPIVWGSAGHQLIWTNTSRDAQAFWDGYGRRVKRLRELSERWGNRMSREVGRGGKSIRFGKEARDVITLTVEGKLYIYGPAE